MSTYKIVYPADSSALTITLASLASSSTFVAGQESDAVSNRSNLDIDHVLAGKITVGTSPTSNTQIQIWVVPAMSFASGTATWPDVFDGSNSAETWTSAGIRDGAGTCVKTILVDSTTTDRAYYFDGISVASFFGGVLPFDYVVWVTHNTGVALNATGGNQSITYTRIQFQSV